MDRGKKPNKVVGNRNNVIYMDLKDIIREHALPFLPAKSLFRCTGVCRDWKLQIATPFFAHNQSNSFRSVSGFFFQSPSGPPSFIPLDPKAYGVPDPSLNFLREPVDIKSSSNGLLCCQGTVSKTYYICNPVTKRFKKLPEPDADHGPDPAVVLIFEPSLLNFTAEYKLICAFPSELEGYEFDIYSSAEGSWRNSGEICFGKRKILPAPGVHADAIVYWQTGQSGITAFDLTRERSQLLYGVHKSLGARGGKLCSASVRGQQLQVSVLSNAYTNTMQMHSNARAWEVKHEINLDCSLLGGASFDLGGVLFTGDEVVLIRAGSSLYSVDLKTKAVSHLADNVDHNARIFGYVNSLVDI